jgi:3'-5' exonuclease
MWSVWGFDAEWPVSYQKGSKIKVALIQFANQKTAYLFHVHLCGLSPSLIRLLKHPYIFKVGVNISGDATNLTKTFPAELDGGMHGVVEIRNIAKEYALTEEKSLASLTLYLLGKELPKPKDIRTGAWDKRLGEGQKQYAALDAVASYLVFREVMDRSYTALTLNRTGLGADAQRKATEGDIKDSDSDSLWKAQWELDSLKWHSKVYHELPDDDSLAGLAPALSDQGGRGGYYGLCKNKLGFYGDNRPMQLGTWDELVCLVQNRIQKKGKDQLTGDLAIPDVHANEGEFESCYYQLSGGRGPNGTPVKAVTMRMRAPVPEEVVSRIRHTI